MKFAIIIPDGCADEPQDSLGWRTPLETANVPHMDAIATAGVVEKRCLLAGLLLEGVRENRF